MLPTRRQFVAISLTLAAGSAGAACSSSTPPADSTLPLGPIDIGPESLYQADGLYSAFRDHGFFILRRNGQLLALSSRCTHRACKINPQPDGSFQCPCHGAKFDPLGHVTQGPAQRNLPALPISKTSAGHLLVDPSATPPNS